MSKYKKVLLSIVICMSTIFLIGAGKKAVELRDNNKLIDLQLAIDDAKIGKQGKTDKKEDTPQIFTPQEQPKAQRIIVSIEDTAIKWNGAPCQDINNLEYRLGQCKKEDTIVLYGDYAEAHVYHQVEDLLDKYVADKKILLNKKPIN